MGIELGNSLVPVLLTVGGVVCTAVGWFARRWITGQHHKEDAESIRQAVELKLFLDQHEISLPEAKQMRDNLRQGKQPVSPAMAKALVESEAEAVAVDGRIDFRDTTIGMAQGLSMRLEQLDSEIDYLLTTLSYGASETRQVAIAASQEAWREYRLKDGEVARLLWEGGTGAPLLDLSRQVEISETRKAELEQVIEAEAQL